MSSLTPNAITLRLPFIFLVMASVVICYWIFGPIFLDPNSYTLMLGGDGAMLYFNILYHTWYGDGLMLTSMNYPEPELIFMTASMASFTQILQYLNGVFPWIGKNAVGIIHTIFIISIVLQYVCLYCVNRKLGLGQWFSALFALCIGSLAPQLVRIGYGHFGLAFPFLIPFTFLWLWSDYSKYKNLPFSICFIGVVLFLGFNNPYLIFLVSMLLLTYGLLTYLRDKNTKHLFPILLGLCLPFCLFVTIQIFDPYEDRIGQQWGHFYFASTFKGLLWDQHSSIYKWMSSYIKMTSGRSETFATLAFSSIVILLIGFSNLLRSRSFKLSLNQTSNKVLLSCLSACVLFTYSSAFFKIKIWEKIIGEIEPLTMLKSSGRISWIVYYAFSLLAVYLFNHYWYRKNGRIFKIFLIILPMIWLLEGYNYISHHVKVKHFHNPFHHEHLESYIKSITNEIDLDGFQALLTIPVVQSWNDNLIGRGEWTTEIHAQSISLATGLPWISSKISRAPVRRSLENISLTSHPLIHRTLPQRFDPNKPILLVKGSTYDKITEGEQHILSKSMHLYHSDGVDLYSIKPEQFNSQSYIDSVKLQCSLDTSWSFILDFDEFENTCGFQSSGGKIISREWEEIVKINIPQNTEGDFELSFWNFVNIEKHGMPRYHVIINDQEGREISKIYLDSRNYYDHQDGWLRLSHNLNLKENQVVILEGNGRYEMCMDQLLIRKKERLPSCYKSGNGNLMINNYLAD